MSEFINTLVQVVFIAVISLALHEMGHYITAKYIVKYPEVSFGINRLGPYVSMGGKYNTEPYEYILLSTSGILINLVIGVVFWSLGYEVIANINFLIFAFNFAPIMGSDGYQTLHGILWTMKMREKRKRLQGNTLEKFLTFYSTGTKVLNTSKHLIFPYVLIIGLTINWFFAMIIQIAFWSEYLIWKRKGR